MDIILILLMRVKNIWRFLRTCVPVLAIKRGNARELPMVSDSTI